MDSGEALEIVSRFFEHEWPATTAKDVTVSKLTDGYCSSLYAVRRSTGAVEEPACVLLRVLNSMFSDPDDVMKITEAEQALVYQVMSDHGLGPRLYGVASGMRVEEFIPSHTLTPIECQDPGILASVARAYAKRHSVQIPLQKNSDDFFIKLTETATLIMKNREENIRIIRSAEVQGGDRFAEQLIEVDFVKDKVWMLDFAERHACKLALCHTDCNYLNVLVREETDENQLQVVLVDYESTRYLYRGLDFGGHFVNRMIDWKGKETKRSGYSFPCDKERRQFLQSYLEEMQKLRGKENEESVDHLMLEADIGSLMYCWTMVITMTKYLKVLVAEPAFLTGIAVLLEHYVQQKGILQHRRD